MTGGAGAPRAGTGALDRTERSLVRLTVAIVQGRWEELRSLRRSAGPGEPDRRWREACLQAHLFAGFPRVVEAFEVLAAEGGLGEPAPDELRPGPDPTGAGREVFARVYAELAPALRRRLHGHHPLLGSWIEQHAYGAVLSREGLSLRTRELLSCAALASLEQERQLLAHGRGALRAGASPAELRACIETAADLLGPGPTETALRILSRAAVPDSA